MSEDLSSLNSGHSRAHKVACLEELIKRVANGEYDVTFTYLGNTPGRAAYSIQLTYPQPNTSQEKPNG